MDAFRLLWNTGLTVKSLGLFFGGMLSLVWAAGLWNSRAAEPLPEMDWINPAYQPVATNNAFMTHITHAGDGSGRLFVVEQAGRIEVLLEGRLQTTPFLVITDRVLSGGERGLLSVAFAPDFETSREFYVNYTRRPDGATVVSRFKAQPDGSVGDPSSEQILVVVPQPASNHNGGLIMFGPDGYLYIGMGDGGGAGDTANNAQNMQSLLGKMLRIDVSGSSTNYAIPPSNPFAASLSIRPEIWASGLRNPWRWSFDRLTGDLWIADVGQNALEEVNFRPANSPGGENYGWRYYEGDRPYNLPANAPPRSSFVFPVAVYGRALGQSVTGGFVIRADPNERAYGTYIFVDYLSGRLWGMRRAGEEWRLIDFGAKPQRITSFGEDEQGNLYATHSSSTHIIYRLIDSKIAHAPEFSLAAGSYNNVVSLTLTSLSAGSRIHYTRDGSDPTESSPFVVSGGTVQIRETQSLRARAYRDDLSPSPIVTRAYTISGVGPVLSAELSSGEIVLRWTGTPPASARIEQSSDLSTWGTLTADLTAGSVTIPAAQTQQYFRMTTQ